jgi:hypothetical protein
MKREYSMKLMNYVAIGNSDPDAVYIMIGSTPRNWYLHPDTEFEDDLFIRFPFHIF